MERTTEYLKELQSLPLDEKVAMTKMRIVEWYEHWNGNVSVSFSGGKDSTVLLDIVRSIYPDVPAVFVDTGLEQPEIREFVRRFDNVAVVRPSMPFNEVLSTYGYPLISKEVSEAIWYARKNTPPVNKTLSGGGVFRQKQAELSGLRLTGGGTLPEHETESAARTMDRRTQRPSRNGQHNMRRNMLCGTWRKPLPEREREREYSDAAAYPNATDYAQRSTQPQQSVSGRGRNERNSATDRPIQSIGQLTLAKSLPCSGGGQRTQRPPRNGQHNMRRNMLCGTWRKPLPERERES